ncbi:MAG TPA: murein biosynthesis integral membrane protein MurJ [Gemmatimonadales bacterium]|nr:murein biosynthesis integral membrane protein MurJ [Gemmatimonadales bacterium]
MTSERSVRRGAFLVALGILASRLMGLVRVKVVAHFLGADAAADAWQAAFKIPNFLQNLFGEGALSASFIPVYAGLLAQDDPQEADRVAGAVGGLLAFGVSVLVLLGVLATPLMIDLIVPGFTGEKRALTIQLVRIVFPGTGLLVLSAWCLGILNSHRRFFLSYAAPVLWNVAIIATLFVVGGRTGQAGLAVAAAWGSVVGSALQVLVQMPRVVHLLGTFRPSLDHTSTHVREVIRNFIPAFVSRGVVQISAYVDVVLASPLPTGAVAHLAYAQTLYTLPVSLFGMSVSAAELPTMSSALGSQEEVARQLRGRLDSGIRRIAFFVVPSAVGFLALGAVMARIIFQSGRFSVADSTTVWAILAGASVGLLATTQARLYSSAFYALRDTRTPLKFGVIRVALVTALGYGAAFPLREALGIDGRWGPAGLTIAAGIAGWAEFLLLQRAMGRRIGRTGLRTGELARLWGAAVLAAAVAWGVLRLLGAHQGLLASTFVLGVFGGGYILCARLFRIPEAVAVVQRLRRPVP